MAQKTNGERQAVLVRLPLDAVAILSALQEHYAAEGGKYSQSDVVVRVLRETGKRENIKTGRK